MAKNKKVPNFGWNNTIQKIFNKDASENKADASIEKFKSSNQRDVLAWLKAHPLEKLYDQYGNYILWGPNRKVVEHNYEIDNENAIWDMDSYSEEEFLEVFDNEWEQY